MKCLQAVSAFIALDKLLTSCENRYRETALVRLETYEVLLRNGHESVARQNRPSRMTRDLRDLTSLITRAHIARHCHIATHATCDHLYLPASVIIIYRAFVQGLETVGYDLRLAA